MDLSYSFKMSRYHDSIISFHRVGFNMVFVFLYIKKCADRAWKVVFAQVGGNKRSFAALSSALAAGAV